MRRPSDAALRDGDLLAGRLFCAQLFDCDVRRNRLGEVIRHLSSGDESSEERLSSFAVRNDSRAVLGAGRQRLHRIEPIQRLNRRLFSRAKHGGMLRRIHIEASSTGKYSAIQNFLLTSGTAGLCGRRLRFRGFKGWDGPPSVDSDAALAPEAQNLFHVGGNLVS
jgi:hypothetical protein